MFKILIKNQQFSWKNFGSLTLQFLESQLYTKLVSGPNENYTFQCL